MYKTKSRQDNPKIEDLEAIEEIGNEASENKSDSNRVKHEKQSNIKN
jgi:hypothetical protein